MNHDRVDDDQNTALLNLLNAPVHYRDYRRNYDEHPNHLLLHKFNIYAQIVVMQVFELPANPENLYIRSSLAT